MNYTIPSVRLAHTEPAGEGEGEEGSIETPINYLTCLLTCCDTPLPPKPLEQLHGYATLSLRSVLHEQALMGQVQSARLGLVARAKG